MPRTLRCLLAALFLIPGLSACGDDPTTLPEEPLHPPNDSPEAVIRNLVTSYRERDIEAYARLLHPEFRFRLQSSDALDFGDLCPEDPCFFDRETDSLGTEALFVAAEVNNIEIDLVHGPAAPATGIDLPPGTMKIRIDQVLLNVNQTDGLTLQVTDQQDFFFLPDPADTTEWLIYEWHDNPPGAGSASLLVRPRSWGLLKRLYVPAPSLALTPLPASP